MVEIHGLVEVADTQGPDQRQEYVRRAFGVSARRGTPVGLVLNAVEREEVDRVLDDLIEEYGNQGPIVYYLDYRDTARLVDVATEAKFVVAVSDEFKERLRKEKIRFVEPGGAGMLPRILEKGAA